MNPKIYATGNETLKGEFNISYYIFEKDDSFLDWLGKLFVEVFEIEEGEAKAKFVVESSNDNDDYSEKIYLKEINKMVDIHEKYEFGENRVDVFYGKDRVYVNLRKSREIRKKFADFVKKTRKWIKIRKAQKTPCYLNLNKK